MICVCVCVWFWEGEVQREKERETERECLSFLTPYPSFPSHPPYPYHLPLLPLLPLAYEPSTPIPSNTSYPYPYPSLLLGRWRWLCVRTAHGRPGQDRRVPHRACRDRDRVCQTPSSGQSRWAIVRQWYCEEEIVQMYWSYCIWYIKLLFTPVYYNLNLLKRSSEYLTT